MFLKKNILYLLVLLPTILFSQNQKSYEKKSTMTIVQRDSLQLLGNYKQSIEMNLKNLEDTVELWVGYLYRMAINHAKLNNNDSAFYYLNRFIDLSEDDRAIVVDQDLDNMRKDTTRWNAIIKRIENLYLREIEHVIHKDLALRLFYLGITDQKYRMYLPIMKQIDTANSMVAIKEEVKNDRLLATELKKIIKEYEFPTISKVGRLASKNALFIMQHAPKIKDKYYKAVKTAYQNNDFDAFEYALLTDKFLMQKKKKQYYGTQFRWNPKTAKKYGDKTVLYPIKDFEHVNERRKAMGFKYTIEEEVENFFRPAIIPKNYYKK